jgi:ATP-dependent RNA helicase DeaD
MSDISAAEASAEPTVAEPTVDGTPEGVPPPASFDAFPISTPVRQAIAALGYTAPTEVQAAVIAAALAGSDMLVQSKTGSGKTAAFGIPLIERLDVAGGAPGEPQALILLPTRELAHQVAAELRSLSLNKGTRTLAVYGGVPMGRQTAALKAGVDIIIATPGRLLDHIRRKNMSLEKLKVVVLDEADEMLSMGFWDDVTELLKFTPPQRQTMLFSATLPYEVAKSAAQFLREPVRVDLSGDDLTVAGIENCIINVLPTLPKPRQMLYALEHAQATNAIIFCNTRNETEMLSKYLTQSGLVAEPLSGNLKQKERDWVMGRIKSGELRYMVATDIAARGIDINDLTHVFNYSLPEFSEVYLHRVGRTGRAGKVGMALSLVDGKGLGTLSQLEKSFGIKFTEVLLPPEETVIRARSLRIMKELAEKAAVAEITGHLPTAQDIIGGTDGAQIVAFLLKSYFNAEAESRRQPQEGPVGRDSHASRDSHSQDDHDSHGAPRAAAAQDGEAVDDGSGPRKRRRRRGRGRAGEGQAEGREAAPARGGREPREPRAGRSGERQRSPARDSDQVSSRHGGLEVVDAGDLLSGNFTPNKVPPVPGSHAEATPVAHAEPAPPAPAPARRAPAPAPAAPAPVAVAEGMTNIRVNIGFDDGFKGRGAVAKKISALAGLNEGIVTEVEARRDHAVLQATPEIAELVMERVDGAPLGKKVITVSLQS